MEVNDEASVSTSNEDANWRRLWTSEGPDILVLGERNG